MSQVCRFNRANDQTLKERPGHASCDCGAADSAHRRHHPELNRSSTVGRGVASRPGNGTPGPKRSHRQLSITRVEVPSEQRLADRYFVKCTVLVCL